MRCAISRPKLCRPVGRCGEGRAGQGWGVAWQACAGRKQSAGPEPLTAQHQRQPWRRLSNSWQICEYVSLCVCVCVRVCVAGAKAAVAVGGIKHSRRRSVLKSNYQRKFNLLLHSKKLPTCRCPSPALLCLPAATARSLIGYENCLAAIKGQPKGETVWERGRWLSSGYQAQLLRVFHSAAGGVVSAVVAPLGGIIKWSECKV